MNTTLADIMHQNSIKNALAMINGLHTANPVYVVNILGLDTQAKREAWAVKSVADGSIA